MNKNLYQSYESFFQKCIALKVIEFSIYHSATITVLLMGKERSTPLLVQFIDCKSYKGRLDHWFKCGFILKNRLEETTEKNRIFAEKVYILEDVNSGNYIKSSFMTTIDNASSFLQPPRDLCNKQNIEELKEVRQLLSFWKEGRMTIWNSNLNVITIRIESYRKREQVISKNVIHKNLHIICYEPFFFSGCFVSGFKDNFKITSIENQTIRIDNDSLDFCVECKYIECKENIG